MDHYNEEDKKITKKKKTEIEERLMKLIAERADFEAKDPGIDYVAEYRKQTGRDLETGKIIVQ